MLFPAEKPLRIKDARVLSLDQTCYMIPVFVSFFTNPPCDIMITRRVIPLCDPIIRFVHIFSLRDGRVMRLLVERRCGSACWKCCVRPMRNPVPLMLEGLDKYYLYSIGRVIA